MILTIPLTSCHSTPKRENNTDVIFPAYPDVVDSEDNVIPKQYTLYDKNNKPLFKIQGDEVLIPLSVFEKINLDTFNIAIPFWYWRNISSFVIDYEAALQRYYNEENE